TRPAEMSRQGRIRAVRTRRTYRVAGRSRAPPARLGGMAVELDHTIIAARDAEAAARWCSEMLDLPDPRPAGRFWHVITAITVALDSATTTDSAEIPRMHYAFRICEAEFDSVYDKISPRGLQH